LGRRRHGACAIQHGYASCGLRLSGFPSKSIALSRMRVFPMRQSDGKTSWIQQVLAASLRKRKHAHRTRPGEKKHAGMFFLWITCGVVLEKGGQWSHGSFPSKLVPWPLLCVCHAPTGNQLGNLTYCNKAIAIRVEPHALWAGHVGSARWKPVRQRVEVTFRKGTPPLGTYRGVHVFRV
jgi:hypothetical protein